MSEESGENPFNDAAVLKSLLYSLETRLPTISKGSLDYNASFKGSAETTESIDLIATLSSTRTNIEIKLLSPTVSLSDIENSINQYLPHLYNMVWSIKTQTQIVLSKPTNFAWRGSYTTNEYPFTMNTFAYELTMCLHTQAMVHVIRAEKLLQDDPRENLSAAGKSYTTASGILDYLGQNLLVRWVDTANSMKPPEAMIDICNAFSNYYQALAQRCAVVKGILNPSTPSGTIAKLCMAVSSLTQTAMTTIDRLSPETQKLLLPSLVMEMNYIRDLYLSLTCYYESQAYVSKQQYGPAIVYCKKAIASLKQKPQMNYQFYASGLPNLTLKFTYAAPGITKLITYFTTIQETLERDNRMIYFDTLPSADSLPPLPPPHILMKKVNYEEPADKQLILFSPSIISSSSSSVTGTDKSFSLSAAAGVSESKGDNTVNPLLERASSTPLSPSVPMSPSSGGMNRNSMTKGYPTISSNSSNHNTNNSNNNINFQRSDSDLARELQAKLNAGENL